MYDGTEVSYDNSSTHIVATDVQGAIDHVYASATDYSNINTTYTRSVSSSVVRMLRWGKLVILTMNDICPKANTGNGSQNIVSGIPEPVSEVITTLPSNTSGSTPSYRVRVIGTNLQWSYVSGGSDSCPLAAGELVYFTN